MRPAIKYRLNDGFVAADNSAALPRRFEATFDSTHSEEGKLELTVEVDDWGRPACSRLTLTPRDGQAITGAMLRRIPVGGLVADAALEAALVLERQPSGTTKLSPPNQSEGGSLAERYASGVRRPRRGSPIQDDHLEGVAEQYRKAQRSPAKRHAPTEAVALSMQVSRSTAGRWVAMARARGLLEPAKARPRVKPKP